jgi:phytoene desaturase
MRPHNRFEDVEGMYLVGGGTHPGSGLPVIYSSARITSDLLLGDLGLDGSAVRPRRGRHAAKAGHQKTAAV